MSACGGGGKDGKGGGDGDGEAEAPGKASSAAPQGSEPPKPPEPRGPVLRSDTNDQPWELRVVSAELTGKRLEDAPLGPGENALRVVLMVRSADSARSALAPTENWMGIAGPGCTENGDCVSGFDSTTDYYPKSDVDGEGQGSGPGLGYGDSLKGGTDYYVTREAVVDAEDSPEEARLCVIGETVEVGPCIPLGTVTKGPGVK